MIATAVVLLGIAIGLLLDRVGAEIVLLTGLTALMALGILPVREGLSGFSDPSVITIGALYVISSGLRSTGAVEWLGRLLLGRPHGRKGLLRMILPITALSGFMNNTPIVACFIPVFVQFARGMKVSPSRLLIPLSYATILGGACTLIGTSTNLVVDGILRGNHQTGFGMFELTWVGLPVACIGLAYLVIFGPRLLPNRLDMIEQLEANPREYAIEMIVRPECPLVGQTIRKAGLRDLPGLYLFQIERDDETILSVGPNEVIQVDDILFFSGVVSTVVDLQKIRGLDPVDHLHVASDPFAVYQAENAVVESSPQASNTTTKSNGGTKSGVRPVPIERTGGQLCEVVISSNSPLVNRRIRDVAFRSQYNASIIAVHRSGEKIQQKIGQITLRVGDTLLIDADDTFAKRWRNSIDFILVSAVEDSAPVDYSRTLLALGITLLVILGLTFIHERSALVAMGGALLMIFTRCIPASDIQRSIELQVLLLVASAIGLGKALQHSGCAEFVATNLVEYASGYGPIVVLGMMIFITGIMTELVSNNATAALMGTLAIAIASEMHVDPRPFLIGVTVAASYGFATPVGYQTNLMVLNPGGYRFVDYIRIGLPLDLITWSSTIAVIALLYNFTPTH